MILSLRSRTYWASDSFEKRFTSSRKSFLRSSAAVFVVCIIAYFVWLLPSYFLGACSSLYSHGSRPVAVLIPGEDAFKHFIGSRDCDIKQTDIHPAPHHKSKLSPFCSTRAALLQALSHGGRYSYDEPYVGKGCTSRWFLTPETCMVVERFNGIIFLGDDVARANYLAFNMILREDLAYGGLKGSDDLSDQDRESCKCDNQFLDECAAFGVTSSRSLKQLDGSGQAGNTYYCDRIPHAYIPVTTVPASLASIHAFKALTYLKPNPWQPSPVVFSFGHASSFDVEMATLALDEVLALARAAERNIPIPFLTPPAIASQDSNTAICRFHQRMATIARQKNVDVLGLYNLTLHAASMDGGRQFGAKVALAEAMFIVNWLSKLETS